MPLEIRELNIKVTLSDSASGGANASQPPPAAGGGKQGDDKEQMLRECLDEVMHLLNNKKER